MNKKYPKKEMLHENGQKNCSKNYQLRPTEMGQSSQKIFIGFKKSKNLNLVPKSACQRNFYLCSRRI